MFLLGTLVLSKEKHVMKSEAAATVYVVVDVMRGVATGACVFQCVADAKACTRRLQRSRNLDEDDVQLFQCVLNEDMDE